MSKKAVVVLMSGLRVEFDPVLKIYRDEDLDLLIYEGVGKYLQTTSEQVAFAYIEDSVVVERKPARNKLN